MNRIRARHYATGELVDVCCDGGRIAQIGPPSAQKSDMEAGYIAPGFFDIQINGCHGLHFGSMSLTLAEIFHIVEACREHGITAFCPTLITNSFAALQHGMATLRSAVESDSRLAAALPAIHLEGPYISPEDGPRGAHPREHVRSPDWEEFQRLQEAAGGRIRLVTLAPEYDGALQFIERLVKNGVVVAIGHTAASGVRIREAIAAGARLSTHLGNGCHRFLPRHDNYLWEQLADDELSASIICDGHHLPPAIMRCIVRVKTPSRLILTCDASSHAGLPSGRYTAWGQEVEILPEGKIVLSSQGVLAGSWNFTDHCILNAVRIAGLSLEDAVDMATARPRELLNLPLHRLESGMAADFVLFDFDAQNGLQVRYTVVAGETIKNERRA